MKLHYGVRIYFESSEDFDVWIDHSILDDIKYHTSRWYKRHNLDRFFEPFEQQEAKEIEPIIPNYSKTYAQHQVQKKLAEIDGLMQWESEVIADRILDYCLDNVEIYYQKWNNRH